MSHQPERKEKDCLNCGSEVLGPYCQVCGQKNTVRHQSFWQLLTHFIYDIFHFDGKFFDTLRLLLFKPGLVPKHYILGKRFSYLDPIRMYLFTSALFFLVFFSISTVGDTFSFDNSRLMSKEERFEAAAYVLAQSNTMPDSAADTKLALLLDTTKGVWIEKIKDTTVKDSSRFIQLRGYPFTISARNDTLNLLGETGDEQLAQTKNKWLESKINSKWKFYKRQYGDDINKLIQATVARFIHWFPYMLFVSLPLFALVLKLLYARQKEYFYSDHAVFTLYHYIFSFILLLLFWAFEWLNQISGWEVFNMLQSLLLIAWPVSLYLALKRFYEQSIGKTFIKFLLVNVAGFLSLVIIFVGFTIVFIYQL